MQTVLLRESKSDRDTPELYIDLGYTNLLSVFLLT